MQAGVNFLDVGVTVFAHKFRFLLQNVSCVSAQMTCVMLVIIWHWLQFEKYDLFVICVCTFVWVRLTVCVLSLTCSIHFL